VAPLSSQEKRWGIARDRYLGTPGVADRIYMDQGFSLTMDGIGDAGESDVQVRAGRHVVQAALADVAQVGRPLDLDHVALVAGTSWSAPSYFAHDTAAVLGLPQPSGPAYSCEAQLEALAPTLRGPKVAVDTACASSLYALDVAAALLARGQADAVVVVGLNVFLPPFLYLGFSKLMALSMQGRIAPFASDASGIIPGECAGALIVEPLERARSAGRSPRAIVRSLGIAADGAERSVFAPGADGQRLAYERAYAGLSAGDVDYVEAHGTATVLGDETELSCLHEFFGPHRSTKLPIGSVKSLIGHTLAAAGIASLIKGLLMLRHGVLPPHIPVTPHGRLRETCLTLLSEAKPWPEVGTRGRRIGISSFGFGGANVHVVLESEPERAVAVAVGAEIRTEAAFELAILDFEAALGGETSSEGWSKRLEGPEEPARIRLFPDKFEVEAQGLRMGPNFLRRIDPLQLLTTHLAHELLARNPKASDSATTGVIVASNFGGEISLRLARKAAVLLGAGSKEGMGPETTLEALASSLPTMASGYLAYHFNLRAFHETWNGGAGTFWLGLLTAPYWLQTRCERLLLGGARLIKSPVEWKEVLRLDREGTPSGEGAALFLLQSAEAARKEGVSVLATLRVVPAKHASSWEGACKVAGVEASSVELRETSELDGEHVSATSVTSRRTGFLAEATGVEVLSRVLLGRERRATVSLCERGELRATLFFDKGGKARFEAKTKRIPLEVSLHRGAKPPAPRVLGPSAVVSPSPRRAAQFMGEGARLAWLRAAERAMQSFFAAQRAAVELLGRDDESAVARRRAENVVIAGVERTEAGVSCDLVVDQGHPYFFDHPLDHVPGILLLEGIVQLAEHAVGMGATGQEEERDIRRLDLRFRRFCETEGGVRVNLLRKGQEAFTGSLVQRGEQVATFSLEVGQTPLRRGGASGGGKRVAAGDATLMHKQRQENVLIGPLEEMPEGYMCDVLAPPPGHFFEDGSTAYYSPVFLLEVARQMVMTGAHDVGKIPLGMPMNLIAVAMTLAGPVWRGTRLRLRFAMEPLTRIETMWIARVRMVLMSPQGELGAIRIKSQVVDAKTYEQQRRSAGP
jgi:3-oxoacyl-(acyl-carrier-protein) synthase